MTNDAPPDRPQHFAARILPWLVAAGALAIYVLTLNHWMSLFNLGAVAKTSGWTWQPELLSPVLYVVTYPFRWLPPIVVPSALDLFSAICAALTLALLARSVALLPHDRTRDQREREHSDFSLLTIRAAWLPPVFAALACGLQMTFWEQATNFTGEIFELLLFALVIWLLLEYRIDERDWRLFLAAFIYGAAMTDNWTFASPNGSALIGFFPIFVAALIWIRGPSFFDLSFLSRMVLCGLAGLSLYLLLPLVTVISGNMPITFWQALKYNWSAQFTVVKLFFVRGDMRLTVGLLSLSSLLPVLALAIRWKSFFGEINKLGAMLSTVMFHVIHGVFLVVCVWVALDPPFSPRNLIPQQLGFSLPFLTFYYLGALSIGYFSGYFLLVFGIRGRSQRRKPQQHLPPANYAIVAAVWVLFGAAVVGLVWKNAPQIHAINGNMLQRYASLVASKLPSDGAILLCDDRQQLFLTQEALLRSGRANNFVPLDTQSLTWPEYHKFLHKKYPQKFPDIIGDSGIKNVNPLQLVSLLISLAKTNELYYLHPSFGYYFEVFYLEPHGLVYKLKTLPNNTLLPPLPDKNLIAENESFCSNAETTVFPPIERAVTPPDANAPASWQDSLFARFHLSREPNPNALVAGMYCSRSLDFWGVQLQRAGELEKAATSFELAQKLNPDNIVAQTNLDFNKILRAGKSTSVDLSKTAMDQFSKYRAWDELLNANGPFDEPSFCFEDGMILVRGGLMRQAIEQFERVRQLVPDDLPARLWLAGLYAATRFPDRALAVLQTIHDQPERFSLNDADEQEMAVVEATAYFEKTNFPRATQLLETEISRDPTNHVLLTSATQLFLTHGLFTNALTVIHDQLQANPDDVTPLLNEGYIDIQVRNYDAAISALSRVLNVQTNNVTALFNRAIAYLDGDKLDDAATDYQELLKDFPKSYQVAYGLGEIAYRKHETNDAVKYYELYLANASTNTPEAAKIIQRLRELKQ